MPGPLWRMAVKFICVCRSTAENLSSGGLWTGNIIQRSVPALTPVNFLMSNSQFGEFTGAFVGITCGDRMMHRHTADFDFFDYEADETAAVE